VRVRGYDKVRKLRGRPCRSLLTLLCKRKESVGVGMSSGKGSAGRRFPKKGPSRAMDGYRIAYKPVVDSAPDVEAEVLAAVYRYLLDRRERRDDDLAADGAEERGEHAK
jgi:hypothetical protein